MTTPPITDQSVATPPDPLAGIDPRLRAAIQAALQQQTPNVAAPPVDASPVNAPPAPVAQIATPSASNLPPTPAPAPPPQPTVAPPTQQKPGIIKGLLTDFLYGGGQAALAHVGLPTDYSKQQDAAKLAIQQQGADDTTAYRQAQVGQLQAAAAQTNTKNEMVTLPNDPSYGKFAGMPVTRAMAEAMIPIAAKNAQQTSNISAQGQNALDLEQLKQTDGNPRYNVIKSVNGEVGLYSKRGDSSKPIQQYGTDTALITGPRNAEARAHASAKYGTAQAMDDEGNPTTISRLQQLQTGTPTMNEKATQTLAGDKLGVDTYLSANKRVKDNISVLRDPKQRAIIARVTEDVERNPGAIDSVINAAIQEQGLAPAGAALITGMKQMNEFGPAFKKFTGNSGAATDSLRSTIHANQPSTANGEAVNLGLLGQDETLARGVLTVLARPSKYSVPSRSAPAAAPAPTTAAPTKAAHPSFFHPLNP